MFADGGAHDQYVPAAARGVVFLSSIPTNMRPDEVRLHLQQHGPIFRTKFTAFPKKQKPDGKGLLPLQFKNGYVEFLKREDAERCVALLNGNPVSTKKRRKSHGQLWNLRLLEDFSWGQLAEEREEKIRYRREFLHSAQEVERNANEAFRRMVLAKKKMESTAAEGSSTKLPPKPSQADAEEKTVKKPKRQREDHTDDDARIENQPVASPRTKPSKSRRTESSETARKKKASRS